MLNKVNREIPDEFLKDGKEVYQGKFYMDGKYVEKASPKTKIFEKPVDSKLCKSIREACEKCGSKDGITISFHSELRNGDYVMSMVTKVLIEEMGLKGIQMKWERMGY